MAFPPLSRQARSAEPKAPRDPIHAAASFRGAREPWSVNQPRGSFPWLPGLQPALTAPMVDRPSTAQLRTAHRAPSSRGPGGHPLAERQPRVPSDPDHSGHLRGDRATGRSGILAPAHPAVLGCGVGAGLRAGETPGSKVQGGFAGGTGKACESFLRHLKHTACQGTSP